MNALTKRGFSSLYNYSNAANPRVYLSVASAGNKIGDLVFELYEDRQPAHADNFVAASSHYVGKPIEKGFVGLGMIAGRSDEDNNGAYGAWNADGDLSLRHHKRGLLTTVSNGPSHNGNEFMVTYGSAEFLDGYQTVFGELVEGQDVLAKIEEHTDRHGNVSGDLSFCAAGSKWFHFSPLFKQFKN